MPVKTHNRVRPTHSEQKRIRISINYSFSQTSTGLIVLSAGTREENLIKILSTLKNMSNLLFHITKHRVTVMISIHLPHDRYANLIPSLDVVQNLYRRVGVTIKLYLIRDFARTAIAIIPVDMFLAPIFLV